MYMAANGHYGNMNNQQMASPPMSTMGSPPPTQYEQNYGSPSRNPMDAVRHTTPSGHPGHQGIPLGNMTHDVNGSPIHADHCHEAALPQGTMTSSKFQQGHQVPPHYNGYYQIGGHLAPQCHDKYPQDSMSLNDSGVDGLLEDFEGFESESVGGETAMNILQSAADIFHGGCNK